MLRIAGTGKQEIRQGDVRLVRLTKAQALEIFGVGLHNLIHSLGSTKKVKNPVLAEGEITGHNHVLEGGIEFVLAPEHMNKVKRLFNGAPARLVFIEAEATLVHKDEFGVQTEDHDAIVVAPESNGGDFYFSLPQRQLDIASMQARYVAD